MVASFSLRSLIVASSTVIVAIGLIIQVNPVTAQEPLSARLDAMIDQELQRINIPPRATVSLAEKAVQARQAILKGDYKSAREIFDDALKTSQVQNWRFYPFDNLMKQVSDVIDPAFKSRLDEWVNQAGTTDALPVLIRAQYYLDRAWFERGTKFAGDTVRDHLRAFGVSITHAMADVDTAIGLDPANPYSFYLKLQILAGIGTSQKMADAFREAITKYPDYFPLYETMLDTLAPKWGGSERLMYAFVDEYAGKAPDDSPLKLLYLVLYSDVLEAASISCPGVSSASADKLRECVKGSIQAKPDLEGSILKAFQLYNYSDHYQFGLAVQYILFGVMVIQGADPYPDTILELAATAMQSDAALNDGTKQNNYVIDRAAAVKSYWKHSYVIPNEKSQQALLDLAHTKFPSEEARDVAAAKIYMDLANNAKGLIKLEDMIKYEAIATRLGGPNNLEYLICSGYHQLGDDEAAIRSCTQAITDRPNVEDSYYWRGIAYLKSNQPDAALADLAIVADSENEFRASAALAMSTIYFDRNDFQAALNVLNKYGYLYNSDVETKATVASSYDNRCYAYMQLGDLRKALSDCTASLKYGSLPDAYSKQQELERRLKGSGDL